MKRQYFFLSAGLLLVVAIAIAFSMRSASTHRTDTEGHLVRRPVTAREKQAVYLYFADPKDRHLSAENRVLTLGETPADSARLVLEALLQGPAGDRISPIPEGTRIRAVYLNGSTAIVDISPEIRDHHPGGSQAELHTIYAVVNSLVLNIPEVRSVKLLIGGKEADTLAGHIDLRFPLTANMLIVR